MYAVASAGMVYSVASSCAAGNLSDCGCSTLPAANRGWKWGGCVDSVRYGVMFAKHFVDAPERMARKKTRDIRAIMNLHNNAAGRLVRVCVGVAHLFETAFQVCDLLSVLRANTR